MSAWLLASPTRVAAQPAAPASPAIRLAALAPADDARRAVVIGEAGEVYEPDGQGAWVRRLPCALADPVAAVGRAGGAGAAGAASTPRAAGAGGPPVVALADGAVYRLAANGWSAIRLAQRGKAILGSGERALAAVGRQLFALDPLTQGEPIKLAAAPATIVSVAAGPRGVVVATAAGVLRVAGGRMAPLAIPGMPARALPRPLRLVSDRWAVVERGALDLTTGRVTAWPGAPGELAIGVAATAPDGALVAIAAGSAGLELVTVRGGKPARDPLGATGIAVGVVVDRAGRAVVALSDGRIALRDRAGWSMTQVTSAVTDVPPAGAPGPAPATSG